ncbi:RluA family pseudouridine synthase, partial [Staphylococcus aureus]
MKFKIPENFNDLSLRDIFQQLKVPKQDLHHLNMSKDITINDKPARLMDKVPTGDDVFVPTIDEKSNYVHSYRYEPIKYEDDDMTIVRKPKGVKPHTTDLKDK